jgi:hypothetical protein
MSSLEANVSSEPKTSRSVLSGFATRFHTLTRTPCRRSDRRVDPAVIEDSRAVQEESKSHWLGCSLKTYVSSEFSAGPSAATKLR